MSRADYEYMARALQLAARGLYTTHPNPRVGCVLVRDGKIVGEGWHERAGEPHAETHALQQAGEGACGATAYVTLEPCCHHGRTPPCTDALIQAGVARVVVAMIDPNPSVAGQGLEQLKRAGIRVETGVLGSEAEKLNPGFIMRMRKQRPYVRCKLAMTLDGRTATATGESKWITGEAARADVQRLRAQSSVIMTGSGTVLADDPRLTVRSEVIGVELTAHPMRVVLDSRLRITPKARLFKEPGETLVFTTRQEQDLFGPLRQAGAKLVSVPAVDTHVDLTTVLSYLAVQREINEILVEAGPTLSGALLQAGLIDEIVIYMAPILLGDSARGLVHLQPDIAKLMERIELEITEIRAVGRDWRITAKSALPRA
ncbi:MAG TPA: bifunctional diaminohydroxyphosphoribosylaminopyrimidine deaminase/5-amino-6-(5-phosphoribosylamino)uracil reductase RibD [Gammaproteobacteria bacterium]|nr:bifunctional diaminohydroxyphosphoribosylaminopyrimidine deaminase/5-amino-6-(5-phosphoribosylamino)uracil reductase RibD [Gammaproteobacteria bacterium]